MPTANLSDIQLYYEEYGQGEPLLFIHGLGSSTRDWEYQIGCFSECYRVVTIDLRGHGRSRKPSGPYTVPLFAGDIAEFLRVAHLAPTHVVGLSLGGFIAFQLAVDHPELMRSLTIVNSAPGLPNSRLRDRLQVGWTLILRRLIVRVFGMRALGRILGKKLFPKPEQQELKITFIERWAENDRHAYLSALAAVKGWNITDRLDSITCQTLIISGEHDFIPLALKQNYVGKLSKAALIVIPESMHFTPIDRPQRFNRVLLDFLGEQRGSP